MSQNSSSIRSGNFPVEIQRTSSPNGSRSSGKGRRRRAAAEQRRIDQERWNELNEDEDDEVETYLMSRSINSQNRRRNRRSQRRGLVQNDYEGDDYIPTRQTPTRLTYSDEADLEMALAISLSLSENSGFHPSGAEMGSGGEMDMSYENLVMLENVPCVLTEEVVDSLSVTEFCENCENEIVCTICQTEFVEGDRIMNLKCTHSFHNECSREWFLNYSKKCPICKCEVVD